MAATIQVVFDGSDPDRLARFWAEVLHYEMERPPAGYATWEAFLTANHVPRKEWNSASAIVDPEEKDPRIYFQKMDTPKPAKNRVHLDVNTSGGGKVPFPDRRARGTPKGAASGGSGPLRSGPSATSTSTGSS